MPGAFALHDVVVKESPLGLESFPRDLIDHGGQLALLLTDEREFLVWDPPEKG